VLTHGKHMSILRAYKGLNWHSLVQIQ